MVWFNLVYAEMISLVKGIMENVTGWGNLHAPIADYAIKIACAKVS